MSVYKHYMFCVYSQDNEVDNFHEGNQNDVQYFPGRGRFVDLKLLKPGRISAPGMQF